MLYICIICQGLSDNIMVLEIIFILFSYIARKNYFDCLSTNND